MCLLPKFIKCISRGIFFLLFACDLGCLKVSECAQEGTCEMDVCLKVHR